jgi:hypothetical protein
MKRGDEGHRAAKPGVSKDGCESVRYLHPRATASPLSREMPRKSAVPQDEVSIASQAPQDGVGNARNSAFSNAKTRRASLRAGFGRSNSL